MTASYTGLKGVCKRVILGTAMLLGVVLSTQVLAQRFPEKSVTLIVPYGAGGPTDRHLRTLAEEAGKVLGQNIVIENRAGANGTNAAAALVRAAADGYTLGILPATVYREPFVSKVTYDPINSFTYIMMLSDYTFGLAVNAQAPWKTWQDFVEDARKRPGQISVGATGAVGTPRIFMDEWANKHKIELNVVPYKSDVDVATAILGGHLDAAPLTGIAVTHIEAGKMRYLAMLTEKRVDRFPNIPATGEETPPAWIASPYGLAAPKGLDPKRLQIIHDAFKQALASAANKQVMEQLNQRVNYMTPQEYSSYALRTLEVEKERVKSLRERKLID